MKEVLLEFIGVFIIVFLFYYMMVIRRNKKYNGNSLTAELAIIKYKYDIDFEKVNYTHILWLTCMVSVLFLSIVLTFLFRTINSNILVAFIAVLVSVPVMLYIYWGIGAIYYKKSKKGDK